MNKRNFVDGEHQQLSTDIFFGITTALPQASGSQISAINKHIETKYYHVRSLIGTGIAELHYMLTSEPVANVFSEPLDNKTFQRHINALMNQLADIV